MVVATYRRSHLLERLARAVFAQDYPGLVQLVIVDDASPDDTGEVLHRLAARHPAMATIRLPHNRGPAAARNAGWRHTNAEVVAFTDDDCVPQPGWLTALVRALDGVDLVQGRTAPDPASEPRRGPFSRTLSVPAPNGFYQTANMAYRRTALAAAGGFDERFTAPCGEDTDLAWRVLDAGGRAAFAPDAVVYHDVSRSSLRSALRDTARWQFVVLAVHQHPGLRTRLHSRWFWRATHPPVLLATGGLAVAALPQLPLAARLAGVTLTIPYLRVRTVVAPLAGGPRRRLAAIPAAWLVDLTEVAVLAQASLRYRTVLL